MKCILVTVVKQTDSDTEDTGSIPAGARVSLVMTDGGSGGAVTLPRVLFGYEVG